MNSDYNYIVKYYLKDGNIERDNYGDYRLCIETSRLNFECNKDITDYYIIEDCRNIYKCTCIYDSRNDNENLDLAKEMLSKIIGK